MKSIFRIYPLWTKTIGLLTLAVGATPTCQAGSGRHFQQANRAFNPFAILLLSLVCNFGGSLNTLQAQDSGFPGAVVSVTRFRGRHQGTNLADSVGGFTIAVILVVGVGERFVEPEGSGLAAPAGLIEQR